MLQSVVGGMNRKIKISRDSYSIMTPGRFRYLIGVLIFKICFTVQRIDHNCRVQLILVATGLTNWYLKSRILTALQSPKKLK